jgi:hypothetical protein
MECHNIRAMKILDLRSVSNSEMEVVVPIINVHILLETKTDLLQGISTI